MGRGREGGAVARSGVSRQTPPRWPGQGLPRGAGKPAHTFPSPRAHAVCRTTCRPLRCRWPAPGPDGGRDLVSLLSQVGMDSCRRRTRPPTHLGLRSQSLLRAPPAGHTDPPESGRGWERVEAPPTRGSRLCARHWGAHSEPFCAGRSDVLPESRPRAAGAAREPESSPPGSRGPKSAQRPALPGPSGLQEPSPAVLAEAGAPGEPAGERGAGRAPRGLLMSRKWANSDLGLPSRRIPRDAKGPAQTQPAIKRPARGRGRLKEKLTPGLPEPFQRDLGDRSSQCRAVVMHF